MKAWTNVNALYQIYPRSFKDANGDGVGDLRGIIDNLDYIRSKHYSLGIDAIWISPFFTSPMVDAGYDVADYRDVDPLFGSIEDFKELTEQAHKRGIKVVIDYVPNHTSSQHPWFQEALHTPYSDKRDYYIWRSPAEGGGPPNNWASLFGGSAWEYDAKSNQYYLHTFFKEQPDLNWENPAVREEMKNVLRFWLDIGVDGFRVDAVAFMAKHNEFLDEPLKQDREPDGQYGSHVRKYSKYGPSLVAHLQELAGVVESYGDRLVFFETSLDNDLGSELEQYAVYYSVNPRICVPFNFGGMWLPWGAQSYGEYLRSFQSILKPGYISSYCFSNHDQSRIVSRFGREQARVAAMILLTTPGIPTVYYGDEIGMENGVIKPEDRQDWSHQEGINDGNGRDPFRTPMQWTGGRYAGFSDHKPWLPLAKNYPWANVEHERRRADSFLALYRRLLQVRNRDETMIKGDYKEHLIDSERNILVYERSYEGTAYIIALNFSSKQRTVDLPYDAHHIVLSTRQTKPPKIKKNGQLVLRPHEGVIVHV